MPNRLLLIVGTGRCGLVSLVNVLNRQPGAKVSLEEPPLLPWSPARAPGPLMRERFARWRRHRGPGILGDAASFYLPYLQAAVAAESDIRVIALWRPRDEVVASFVRFLDGWNAFRTDHWADEPAVGLSHDALWTRSMPKYAVSDREEGLRRYWDEYDRRLTDLAGRYPANIRVFDMRETLNAEAGQRALLEFAGWPARRTSNHPLDPGKCAVLVPFTGSILPGVENGLRELERRGYQVRRVGGFAAIDQGRNQLATDALLDGFDETLWIDADVEFHPDSVEQLRAHGLPICCGVYAQKGRKALACHVLPGAPRMSFGKAGGLQEILYAGAGFLHVRRQVYLTIQHRLGLPLLNERFGSPMIPFFSPMWHEIEDGPWYLAEDYALCERARRCDYKVVADTSIRLWHIGTYPYGWEDSGIERERTGSFTLNFPPPPGKAE